MSPTLAQTSGLTTNLVFGKLWTFNFAPLGFSCKRKERVIGQSSKFAKGYTGPGQLESFGRTRGVSEALGIFKTFQMPTQKTPDAHTQKNDYTRTATAHSEEQGTWRSCMYSSISSPLRLAQPFFTMWTLDCKCA